MAQASSAASKACNKTRVVAFGAYGYAQEMLEAGLLPGFDDHALPEQRFGHRAIGTAEVEKQEVGSPKAQCAGLAAAGPAAASASSCLRRSSRSATVVAATAAHAQDRPGGQRRALAAMFTLKGERTFVHPGPPARRAVGHAVATRRPARPQALRRCAARSRARHRASSMASTSG